MHDLDCEHVLAAFVIAMVWGYGDRGYGPTRVRWIFAGVKRGALTAPVRNDVADHLREAVASVRNLLPVKGFDHMRDVGHVKHLGSAFFTKWLYFVTALNGPDDARAVPILDKQVHDWLKREAGMALDISRTAAYESYLTTLEDWAEATVAHRCKLRK
jgi:hypothetical protein